MGAKFHAVQVATAAVLSAVVTFAVVEAQRATEPQLSLNHVGIRVADLEAAVAYYTGVVGLSEAFRGVDDDGNVRLVYLRLGEETFLELNPVAAGQSPGVSHFGVEVVGEMSEAVAQLRQRGATVSDPFVSGMTGATLATATDPNGIAMEMLELPPDSLHRQALRSSR